MTRETIENALLVAVAAVLLSTAYMLDADDLRDVGLTDAQLQAQQEARRERAAAQLCFKTSGYGSAPTWNERGELICRRHDGHGKGVKVATE